MIRSLNFYGIIYKMPATKIINVSKSDDFEDVFDLFKNTDAEDVILIFPKGSRFVKQEQYFEAIKEEADSSGKQVSIMSADPLVAQFALKYGFDVLESQSAAGFKKQRPAKNEEVYAEQPSEELLELPASAEPLIPASSPETDYFTSANPVSEKEFVNEEPEAVLTVAGNKEESEEFSQGRAIKDILPSRFDRNLRVEEERERTFDVDIENRVGEAETQRGDIAKIWAGEKQKRDSDFLSRRTKKFNPPKFFKKVPLLLTIGAVLVLAFVLYSTLGSAQIIISPAKQKLDFKLNVSASSTATAVNFNFNQIPGQQFREQKKETDTFPVTGQKDVVQKASGTITIFNKGVTAQRLVATTRFKSPDGLVFRIPQTINVPAGAKTGATVTPGSVVVAVYADRPGAEYNIGPTQFTIPGFEGTPKFNDFYATSDKPMAGGIIGPAKVVTEGDFAKAQEALTAKVKDEILKSLKDRGGELKILDAIAIKLDAPEVNAKVGEAAEDLEMSIQGSADTIAFRESDLIELIKNFVSQKNNMELLLKDLVISYTNPQSSADKTSLSFDAQVSGWAAAKLDTDAIKNDVRGMSEDSIRSYLNGIKEIDSTRIILSPFWVRSIPKDVSKIRIDIQN